MCQECVAEGRYSQEQYDQEIMNGNLDVLPLMDLPPERIADELVKMVQAGEMTVIEAYLVAADIARERNGEKS